MNFFKWLRSFTIIFSLMLIAGCASSPDLKIGIAPSYPPLAFMKDGSLAGIEPDLAEELFRQTGRGIKFEIMAFDHLIPSLKSGQIDMIMAGMSITPERQGLVSFTNSYMKTGQMLLIREKDLKRFPKILFNQAEATRIGVERGSTGEQYVLKSFVWGTVTHFDTTEAGVRALEQGSIDCFVHDAPTIWRFSADLANQRPGLVGLFEPLTDEPLAWAVRKNDQPLLIQMNREIERMRKEGTLQKILNKWLGTRIVVVNQ